MTPNNLIRISPNGMVMYSSRYNITLFHSIDHGSAGGNCHYKSHRRLRVIDFTIKNFPLFGWRARGQGKLRKSLGGENFELIEFHSRFIMMSRERKRAHASFTGPNFFSLDVRRTACAEKKPSDLITFLTAHDGNFFI